MSKTIMSDKGCPCVKVVISCISKDIIYSLGALSQMLELLTEIYNSYVTDITNTRLL